MLWGAQDYRNVSYIMRETIWIQLWKFTCYVSMTFFFFNDPPFRLEKTGDICPLFGILRWRVRTSHHRESRNFRGIQEFCWHILLTYTYCWHMHLMNIIVDMFNIIKLYKGFIKSSAWVQFLYVESRRLNVVWVAIVGIAPKYIKHFSKIGTYLPKA